MTHVALPTTAPLPRAHPRRGLPECPRCGYDQSGVLPTWTSASPLQLTCSECGYLFLVRDVLNPEYVRQARLFEHAQRRLLSSLALTISRSLRPWRFWRWVRLEQWIVPRRIIFTVLVGALALHALGAAAASGALACALWTGATTYWDVDWINPLIPTGPGDIWVADFEGIIEPGLGWISINAAWALLAALLMPACFLLLRESMRAARVRHAHLLRIFAYGLIPLPLISSAAYLAYFGWLIADVIQQPRFSLPTTWSPYVESVLATFLFPTLTFAWLFTWWGFAASRYLRLDRPWFVAFMLLPVAALASALLCIGLALAGVWAYP